MGIVAFAAHAAAQACSTKCSNDDLMFSSPKESATLSTILGDIKGNADAVLAVQKEVTDVVNDKITSIQNKIDNDVTTLLEKQGQALAKQTEEVNAAMSVVQGDIKT